MRMWPVLVILGCGTEPAAIRQDSDVEAPVGEADAGWSAVRVIEQGTLCFQQPDQLVLELAAPDCVEEDCLRNPGGSCAMQLSGASIAVTGEVSWEQNLDPDAACNDYCVEPSVTCRLDPLPAGSYEVLFGGQVQTLELPTELTCLEF